MATGAPDFYDRNIIMGDDGGVLRAVKVDSNGQIYIAMTGQSLNVGNLPSDYIKDGGGVVASGQVDVVNPTGGSLNIAGNVNVPAGVNVGNLPSDYIKDGGNVAVPGGLDVNSSPPVQGQDGATPHVVAVDAAGIILARMKGAFGAVLKDIAVDTNGIMVSRMKGAFGAVLKDISIDANGVMISRMQGQYAGAAKDMALDVDGNMQAKITGDYEGTPKQLSVDQTGRMFASLYGRNKIPFNMETFRHCNSDSEIDNASNAWHNMNPYSYIHGSGSLQMGDSVAGNCWIEMLKGSTHFNYYKFLSFYYRAWGTGAIFQVRLWKDASNYLYKNIDMSTWWKHAWIDIWGGMTQVGSCTPNDAVSIRFCLIGESADKNLYWDWIRSHNYDDFCDDPKPLQVNEYGGLPVYLMGLYEGSPVIINCDIDGNIKLNINAQDLKYQQTRLTSGSNKLVTLNNQSYAGATTHTILNLTSKVGSLDGGSMYSDHSAGASAEDTIWWIVLDGTVIAQRTFKQLNDAGITDESKGVVYIMYYDNTNKRFRVGFRKGMSFESSLLIQFVVRGGSTAHVTGDINYSHF